MEKLYFSYCYYELQKITRHSMSADSNIHEAFALRVAPEV